MAPIGVLREMMAQKILKCEFFICMFTVCVCLLLATDLFLPAAVALIAILFKYFANTS